MNWTHNDVTYGDKYGPAMTVQTEDEADFYFEACVQHSMAHGYSRQQAEDIERQNLAYWAGYYDNETRERVERLFHCAHPIYGAVKNGPPNPALGFAAGALKAIARTIHAPVPDGTLRPQLP